mgnify:CR=1 FL=1
MLTDVSAFVWGRQKDVLFSHFGAEEGIRNLNQNTGAVAAQRISTDRAAMIKIF